MLDFFQQELTEQCQVLAAQLLLLEQGDRVAQTLEQLMRAAHSLKGAARVVRLEPVVKVAHALEDCFVKAQAGQMDLGQPEQVDRLLAVVDGLEELGQWSTEAEVQAWLDQQRSRLEGWLRDLEAIAQGVPLAGVPVAGEETTLAGGASLRSLMQPSAAVSAQEMRGDQSGAVDPRAVDPGAAGVEAAGVEAAGVEAAGVEAAEDLDFRDWELPDFVDEGLLTQFGQEWSEGLGQLSQSVTAQPPDYRRALAASQQISSAARILQVMPLIQLFDQVNQALQSSRPNAIILELLAGLSRELQPLGVVLAPESSLGLPPDTMNCRHRFQVGVRSCLPGIAHCLTQLRALMELTEPSPTEPSPTEPSPTKSPPATALALPNPSSPAPLTNPALQPRPASPGGAPRSASGASSSSSSPEPASNSPSMGATERVVRVSGTTLNQLMALAGETLVEANWLQPFADSLQSLRQKQLQLEGLLHQLQDSLDGTSRSSRQDAYMHQTQQLVGECRQVLGDRLQDLEQYVRRSVNLSDRLYRTVIASNMRPFADGVRGFPRLVRDVSRKLNKPVDLEIRGETTLVDRDILEKLETPLTHLLQNAIDHGLETAQRRLALGKPQRGQLRLEAFHRNGVLTIQVADDGQGIDPEGLRQTIVQRGLLDGSTAQRLNEAELMDFLFLPGFSLRDQVTEISGRGVGLDLVHAMVQEVGGTLRATSQVGLGSVFQLQLPLTLSVLRTLIVEIAGEPYALPLTRIDRVVRIDAAAPGETLAESLGEANLYGLATVESRQYFQLGQQTIGVVDAQELFELSPLAGASSAGSGGRSDTLAIVVVSTRSHHYGLRVDRFLGEKDLVVRPLDSRLGKVPNFSAAAILEDGSPILIVDVEDLIRSIEKGLAGGVPLGRERSSDRNLTQVQKRILVVDDSITVREVERKLLENQGYRVEVAVNGMDGWNAIRAGGFDLVISDVDMPRMNGFEMVTQIRQDLKFADLPVIMVSYKDRDEDRLRGLEVGANYYLTKSSFQDDTLIQAVVDLIGEA